VAEQSSHIQDQGAADTVPAPASRLRLRIVQILTVVIVIVALGASLYFRDHLQELQQYGYAAVFIVGLVSNATVILPVPGLAVSSVMGGVFNPWIVGIVGGVSQALGELTGYMAGYSGHTWIETNQTYERVDRWMRRYGALTIFVMAVIPNPVFDVGGIIAGAMRFPVWKFLVSCTAGKVIKNIGFALIGFYGTEALFRLLG
jgi:membrane protein YqaA with SNARE-associated domain